MDENEKTVAANERPLLRAKPVKGAIDYAAMIEEHIARYPKIIAALAEAERRCAERKKERS
jgi:hypothetical protein